MLYCPIVIGQIAMVFHVDFKSGKPVYLQLVDQVRYAAASGALRPGDLLPSIRPLAEELRVNRNTVAKAYTELESRGIIETAAGKGCFLKENDSPLNKQVRHKLLVARIDEAVVTAYQMQVGPEVLRGLVDERIQFFDRKKAGTQPGSESDPQEKEQIWTPTNPSSTFPISADVMENWTPSTD
ncbi:MAG TPA: GntR family transcriptional regulator [Verrucomicrobiae bacterium]|nr:GntR family transcriptional regulator [Verrucomicrobiae bacterium]